MKIGGGLDRKTSKSYHKAPPWPRLYGGQGRLVAFAAMGSGVVRVSVLRRDLGDAAESSRKSSEFLKVIMPLARYKTLFLRIAQ